MDLCSNLAVWVCIQKVIDSFTYLHLCSVQVLAFLDGKENQDKVKAIMGREEISPDEKLLIRRFITVNIVYRNAQRQGAVTNMTMLEFEARRKVESSCGSFYVVSVHDHKTAALYGSARVIVTEEVASLIPTYIVSCELTLTFDHIHY